MVRFAVLASCALEASAGGSCFKSVPHDLTPGGRQTKRSFQMQDSDFRLGSIQREYYVNIPQGYTGHEQLPVVVYFHGWRDDTSCGRCHFREAGNQHNFITVLPVGLSDGQAFGASWNVLHAGRTDVCDTRRAMEVEYSSCKTVGKTGPCNCYTCYDDVKFFSELMQHLMQELCIDEHNIFATGNSNGAMLLYPLAAELHKRNLQPKLKAIAPWYGAFFKNMEDVPNSLYGTSVVALHGLYDNEIPPDSGKESVDGYFYTPIDHTLSKYASLNGCAWQQSRISTAYDRRGNLQQCLEYQGCHSGARVVRCNFNEGHSFWPSFAEEMLWSLLKPLVALPSPEVTGDDNVTSWNVTLV